MARLLIHVEGRTEMQFVNEVLRSHLVEAGYHGVDARLIGNAQQREKRGGNKKWATVRTDIVNHLRADTKAFATTLVDFYALHKSWPCRDGALSPQAIEAGMRADISEALRPRFVPFVMMHEFEALLFSDCEAFCRAIGQPQVTKAMTEIREKVANPEQINDSPHTAPSKHLLRLMPGYQKVIDGIQGCRTIGLAKMRTECPHFNEWIESLSRLAGT